MRGWKTLVRDLVTGYSIETTVREAARIDRFGDSLRPGTRVYIAHVPGTDWQETVALATRLRKEQMEPVPHIVARRISGPAQLDDVLKRLVGEAGVTQVLALQATSESPSGMAAPAGSRWRLREARTRNIGVAVTPNAKRRERPVLPTRSSEKHTRVGPCGVHIVTQFRFSGSGARGRVLTPRRQPLPLRRRPGLATATAQVGIECAWARDDALTNMLRADQTDPFAAPDELIGVLAAYKKGISDAEGRNHFFPSVFGSDRELGQQIDRAASTDCHSAGRVWPETPASRSVSATNRYEHPSSLEKQFSALTMSGSRQR